MSLIRKSVRLTLIQTSQTWVGRARLMKFRSPDEYLGRWSDVLQSHPNQAVDSILGVEGVAGLVIGGSFGRGQPWPLSDIDLLPIYEDSRMSKAKNQVARVRADHFAPSRGDPPFRD